MQKPDVLIMLKTNVENKSMSQKWFLLNETNPVLNFFLNIGIFR